MNISKGIGKARSLPIDQSEDWVLGREPLDVQIEELGANAKPDMLACLSPSRGTIVGGTVVAPDVPESEVASWVLDCMISPVEGEPRRPRSIALTGGGLKHLQPMLEELGISVTATSFSHPSIQEAVSMMEQGIGEPGMPPYMFRSRLKSETIGEFFAAAAGFYKRKPWKLFEYEMPIKVEIASKGKTTYWAVVMGILGENPGLALYRSFDDLTDLFDSVDEQEAAEVAQRVRSTALNFEDINEIGPAAEQEFMDNKWDVAARQAYPSAIVTDPKSKELVRRPKEGELADLTLVLRALTEFFTIHRKEIKEGEVVEDTISLDAPGGAVDTSMIMPAPEWEGDDEDEGECDVFGDLLGLDAEVNPGVRHLLATHLLEIDNIDELDELLKMHKNDKSAFMLYCRALADYRKHGASTKSAASLKKAMMGNPHVPDYLLGRKRLPKQLPVCCSDGGAAEALIYAGMAMGVWKATEGAIEWLAESTDAK